MKTEQLRLALGFPCGSVGKVSTSSAGDLGLIPGLGRSCGEGKGYPLQDSGLEKSMDCKAREFKKISTSALLTMPKPLTLWITTNCGKFLKRWEYRPPYLSLEKSVCTSKSNS